MKLTSRPWIQRGGHLVVLQFVLMFGFILTPAWNPLIDAGTLDSLAPLRWGLALVPALAALALGGFGVRHLGDVLTPLPYPVDHSRLVSHGVYRIVRHPLYSSQLFAALAWILYSLSLTHLALLAVGGLFFDYKATREERWLTERHPEYPEYARRVRKLIPWIY